MTAHLAAVRAGKRGEPEHYTDDTAMARQIALRWIPFAGYCKFAISKHAAACRCSLASLT